MKRTPTTELEPEAKVAKIASGEVVDDDGVWVVTPSNIIAETGRYWLSIRDMKSEDYVIAEISMPYEKPEQPDKERKYEKVRAIFFPKSGGSFRVKSFFYNKATFHWMLDNWDMCQTRMKSDGNLYVRIFKCAPSDPYADKFDRCKRGFYHCDAAEFRESFEKSTMMHPIPLALNASKQ